jgi:hypothetical protein
MAKYGKNNYFDGVILPEPKEEMLRRMAKGVDASKGYLTTNASGVLFEGPRTFVCHFKYEAGIRLQGIAGFTVPMMALEIAPSTNLLRFYCGTTSATAPIVLGNSYQAVISYDGTTAVCYLNGSEAARFTVAGYAVTNVFRIGNPSYPPVGPVYSSSHFNYALSAGEVSALWNNGDPAGYVLSGALKLTSDVNYYKSDFSEGVDNWIIATSLGGTVEHGDNRLIVNAPTSTSGDFASMQIYRSSKSLNKQRSYFSCKVVTSEADISEIAVLPWSWLGVRLKKSLQPDGKLLWTGVFFRNLEATGFIYLNLYTKKEISYEIYDIECKQISCVAEYLPGNLIPTAEGSVIQWLDSAPQLPEANGILPPLDASVGGYDLAAIGNPKIII